MSRESSFLFAKRRILSTTVTRQMSIHAVLPEPREHRISATGLATCTCTSYKLTVLLQATCNSQFNVTLLKSFHSLVNSVTNSCFCDLVFCKVCKLVIPWPGWKDTVDLDWKLFQTHPHELSV